jgi:ribosomal protein L12E/L44/L45/RPP1/RPP2
LRFRKESISEIQAQAKLHFFSNPTPDLETLVTNYTMFIPPNIQAKIQRQHRPSWQGSVSDQDLHYWGYKNPNERNCEKGYGPQCKPRIPSPEAALEDRCKIWGFYIGIFSTVQESQTGDPTAKSFSTELNMDLFCQYGVKVDDLVAKNSVDELADKKTLEDKISQCELDASLAEAAEKTRHEKASENARREKLNRQAIAEEEARHGGDWRGSLELGFVTDTFRDTVTTDGMIFGVHGGYRFLPFLGINIGYGLTGNLSKTQNSKGDWINLAPAADQQRLGLALPIYFSSIGIPLALEPQYGWVFSKIYGTSEALSNRQTSLGFNVVINSGVFYLKAGLHNMSSGVSGRAGASSFIFTVGWGRK